MKNMLIRSQLKYKITNMRLLTDIVICPNKNEEFEVLGFGIGDTTDAESTLLGIYTTEEKSLKVLDKIVEQYTELETNKALATANMKCLYETDFDLARQYESCIKSLSAFQMPKDDEV